MGHRFSKTAANNIAAAKTTTSKTKEQLQAFSTATTTTNTTTNVIPIPNGSQQQQQQQKFLGHTINLQIQESPNIACSIGTNYSNCSAATSSNNRLTAASGILQTSPQLQQTYTANSVSSSSLTSINNLSCGGHQIIIKIQLAKMENGNEMAATTTTPIPLLPAENSKDSSLENLTADYNLNSTDISSTAAAAATAAGAQFLNLTLNSSNSSSSTSISRNNSSIGNCIATPSSIGPTTSLTSLPPLTTISPSTSGFCGTAGSSSNQNNNYLSSKLNSNCSVSNNDNVISCSGMTATTSKLERPERLNPLQFNDEIFEQNIGEIVEYCEVLEQQQPSATTAITNNDMQMLSICEETDNNETNACCQRKSKSLSASGNGNTMTSSSSTNNNNTGTKAKSRCRKCSCRDAFRRFLDPTSRSSKTGKQQQQKEQKRNKSQDRHSTNNNASNSLIKVSSNSMHSNVTNINNATPATASTTTATAAIVVPSLATNQVSLWGPAATRNGNDVLIPITTPSAPPQFVVVQCAIVNASNPLPPTNNTLSSNCSSSTATNNSLMSIVPDISPTTSSSSNNEFQISSNSVLNSSTNGPIVHSQVDFVHYLVPDLERITNSSFYWGKMDRYEAERLLEGKPEGTFLLRDSAQEEFLFSVTFRKYGRSLHARIEQSGHRFSFDCHDPCVFTAPTVTGLLEHYKDPACVMFFEPMLTIPLHRKNCFSLQKLCRATIVSNTTYDGINELELPARLKAYLKEYHYKQKLRVKFNEPTYTVHCK